MAFEDMENVDDSEFDFDDVPPPEDTGNRTFIIIAHRLSTVKDTDRIIVIDKGDILEEGSHEELLSKGGEYATLYHTYFKHQEITWTPSDLVKEPVAGISHSP